MEAIQNRFAANVVFVDDEADILELLEVRFEPWVTNLKTFTDPRVALAYVKDNPVDLMVMDLKMPKMDGLELFGAARKLRPSVVGIFLTGFGDKESVQTALKLGAYDFIDKPFNEKSLQTSLRRVLEKVEQDRLFREVLELFIRTNTQLDPAKFETLSSEDRSRALKAALGVARMQLENMRSKKT